MSPAHGSFVSVQALLSSAGEVSMAMKLKKEALNDSVIICEFDEVVHLGFDSERKFSDRRARRCRECEDV